MGQAILTWVGECSAWECDELGHLNMRHYMTKVHQARQMFVIRLGLDDAFVASATSSVRVRDFHIKYMGEARPGDPLRIETGLIALHDATMEICHVMYHFDGRVAATIVEKIEHISLVNMQVFDWPRRVRERADDFKIEMPARAKPRGLTYDEIAVGPNADMLHAWGLAPVGAGVFQPREIGSDKTVAPEAFMGRTTETISSVPEAWPEFLDPEYLASGNLAVLLEARVFLHRPAFVGEPYAFYSGLHRGDAYTRRLIHNMINPLSGESYMTKIGVGCLFDMSERKLIKASDAQIQTFMQNAHPDMTP